jgi:hypothetical protein
MWEDRWDQPPEGRDLESQLYSELYWFFTIAMVSVFAAVAMNARMRYWWCYGFLALVCLACLVWTVCVSV